MCGTDTERAITAARALARFEFLCASVAPDKAAIEAELTASYALQYSRLLCHYARNDFFLEPDQLIRGIGRLSEIAGYIVQGQFDWICPPAAAVRLHQSWPGSILTIVRQAGHSAADPAIASELLATMERIKGFPS